MEKVEKNVVETDLNDFKIRILSLIEFIDVMLKTESRNVDKEQEHLINIYNEISEQDGFINRLKSVIYRLIIMDKEINADIGIYNKLNGENILRLYPQVSTYYLEYAKNEEFISWFNVVVNNHLNISKSNINQIDMMTSNIKVKERIK